MAGRADINLRVGLNTEVKTINVAPTSTPDDAFKRIDVDYAKAVVYLSGSTLGVGDVFKSFADLGIEGDSATLIGVIKQDNQ